MAHRVYICDDGEPVHGGAGDPSSFTCPGDGRIRSPTVRYLAYGGPMTEPNGSDDTDATPWEPPLAGSEVDHLLGALDRLRATFRWKADDLDAAGLAVRIGASTLTLGGLLKHVAAAEEHVTTVRLTGATMDEHWADNGWEADDDWEFHSAADDAPETLYDLYDGAVARSRARLAAALADRGLDGLAHMSGPDGRHASVRRLVCDLIEEYGRHTGHADLIREAVDGRTGEDPPPGWRARSGTGAWQDR